MRKFIFAVATGVAATVGVGAGTAAWATPAPQVQRPCAFQAKWILRPAESTTETPTYMGWETVNNDDLSYPGPRTGC